MRTTRSLRLDPLKFVRHHGIVLESAKGLVPTLAEQIAGESIPGSWWRHPKARQIFSATRRVRSSSDILVCRLLDGHITYVHRGLWPALFRLRRQIGIHRLACVKEEHTLMGSHEVRETAFSQRIPNETKIEGGRLTRQEALTMLGLDRMSLILGTRQKR
jgi:hypothetical protein